MLVILRLTEAGAASTRQKNLMKRVAGLAVVVALSGCVVDVGPEGGDPTRDGHDHDFADLVRGQGVVEQAERVSGSWSPAASVVANADTQTVQYDGAPAWDGGANCADGMTPGARVLRDALIAAYPQVDSVGGFNCRVIAGTNSMSLHGTGRALDIMLSTISGDADNGAGDPIAAWLMQHAELLGLQLIIWDHTIWSTSRSPGSRVRAYSGENPHVDHLHVEINEQAAAKDLPWYDAPVAGDVVDAPCPALPAGGGVVDDGPCQRRFGPAQYWRSEESGEGGQLFWTNAWVNDAPSNWAQTTIKVAVEGDYDVDALFDPEFAAFAAVRYVVDGRVVVVDQSVNADSAALGAVHISAAGIVVVVEDNYGAVDANAKAIVVDGFRVAPVVVTEEPVEEEPAEEEPVVEDPVVEEPDDDAPVEDEGEIVEEPVDEEEGAGVERVVIRNADAVEVRGGCAAGGVPGAAVFLCLPLLLRRRRR